MTTTLSPYLDRLKGIRAALTDLRPDVAAGEPWPLAAQFGAEPEASWGPPEVLAHLAEMFGYWYGQLDLVLAGRSGPVPFGRTQEDAVRIAAIGRDRSLPAARLFDRIDARIQQYWVLLPRLTDADLARVGMHPARGEMTIPEILDQLVIGHAQAHVAQLREALART